MGSPEASAELAADLRIFVREQEPADGRFSTFAAVFISPRAADEMRFERLLWTQLQHLHGLDEAPWAPRVSMDPDDASFAFSFAGRAFFVVGLHPGSSRLARRFAWPALVFNARFQFDRLRERGRYRRMRDLIRARDVALQGDTNPMLADFGERSEARQYSGRPVGDGWVCPFHATVAERKG
jgi:FPC/CPF motif-containing protein YcgG